MLCTRRSRLPISLQQKSGSPAEDQNRCVWIGGKPTGKQVSELILTRLYNLLDALLISSPSMNAFDIRTSLRHIRRVLCWDEGRHDNLRVLFENYRKSKNRKDLKLKTININL